jgi:tripartite-type tricarboxylate transporter receptor subunit TctC
MKCELINHSLRRFAGLIMSGLLLGFGLGTVVAQDFPNRPVRIVVPFGPGGVGDLTARVVAARLSEIWGTGVVIENRPGAGGISAADTVIKSKPDGHTLFLMSNGTAVTEAVFQKLPFNSVQDFIPISTLGYFDIAVVVIETSPHKSFRDLVAFAKANPGKLNVGSINIGSTQNLAAELFKSSAGIDVQIVPYNGTPALLTAIRGGQIDVVVEVLGPVLSQVQAKAVRVLAVSGERRSIVLPDVPTARESGVPGFIASSWNGLAAPAKTPAALIERLNRDIATALETPEVKKKLQELNVEARASTPQQTAQLLVSDIKRWSDVVRSANIPRQ